MVGALRGGGEKSHFALFSKGRVHGLQQSRCCIRHVRRAEMKVAGPRRQRRIERDHAQAGGDGLLAGGNHHV